MPARRTTALTSLLIACISLAVSPTPASAVEFDELAGWWHGPVEHAGQSSEVYLHFVAEDGKQMARLSMVAMDAWDVPVGTVTIEGDMLDMTPYPFPLEFDRRTDTLSGVLPEAAVPVYRIPVKLRRVDAPTIPEPRRFDHPVPEAAWSTDTGAAVWAGLALDPQRELLLVANEAGTVHALDRTSGEVRWRRDLGAAVRARPTIDGSHAYAIADDGRITKLEVEDGAIAWQATADSGGPPRIEIGKEGTRYDRYASRIVAHGPRLYFGGRDGALHALDADSGREIWKFATGDIITAAPAVAGDVLIAASFDGHAYGIDAQTGKQRWRTDLKGPVPGDVVVANGIALAGSRSYDLVALDAATGTLRWQYYYWFSWIESPAQIVDGVAYVGSSDALSLFAFDLSSGRLQWQRKVPGWAWPQPAVQGNTVYVATIGIGPATSRRQGAVTAVDRVSSEILWVHKGTPIEGAPQWGYAAAPVADAERVYAADLTGRVIALRTGAPRR